MVGQCPGVLAAEAAEVGEANRSEEEKECPSLHAHAGGPISSGSCVLATYSALVGEGEEGAGMRTPSNDALANTLLENEEGIGVAKRASVADLLTPNTSRSCPRPSLSVLCPSPSPPPSFSPSLRP